MIHFYFDLSKRLSYLKVNNFPALFSIGISITWRGRGGLGEAIQKGGQRGRILKMQGFAEEKGGDVLSIGGKENIRDN